VRDESLPPSCLTTPHHFGLPGSDPPVHQERLCYRVMKPVEFITERIIEVPVAEGVACTP